MAEQDEDYSSLPLPDRFAHKNWKVRKEGYEAAAKEFGNAQTETDPVVREFIQDSGLLKAAVCDANVAAHQEALVALCAFLKIAGYQGCTRTRSSTLAPLIEKGLTSTKPIAKQKAMEAILLYVELDKPDPVIEEILPLLSHKLPKVVGAALSAYTAICHEFGCKTVDPKPIIKVLPKAFGHADKNVRTEAQNLTSELYRWLREGMKPLFWNDLKPVQQQDLEKLFDKVKEEPPPKPERLLKSQQAAAESVAATASSSARSDGEVGDDGEEPVDLEPEFMAVDIMPKIPKDLEERLASTKWKDRKEALDDLHTAINVPAMEEGSFDDILRSLAKCMKDANIMVVAIAANCIELFAKGLGKKFAKYRIIVMKPLLERLKEKKQSVTDALGAALDAVCAATSLSDCLEDIMEAFKDKNPLVKLESTRFVVRALKTTREAPSLPDVKTVAEAAIKLIADSQETQRTAAAELMGVLLKIMGERIMNTHLEGLDDIRKTKIKEFSETAEVRAKYKPKPTGPAPKAAPPAMGQKRPPGMVKKMAPESARKPLLGDDEHSPALMPLQPKPTARSGVPKSGAPPSGVRGLKPPTASAATKRPGAPNTGQASPRRPQRSPSPEEATTPAPKFSRGLTGRNLGKPAGTASDAVPEPSTSTTSATSSAERLELENLRAETERLRSSNEKLRSENTKLTSQLRDLQEQNSQLIEDHTRDVLSIRAKETQLVRARSDAESAEQTVTQLQYEADRLKRELGRADRGEVRHTSLLDDDYERHNNNGNANVDVFQESERGVNRSAHKQPVAAKPRRVLASPLAGGKENDLRAIVSETDSGYGTGSGSGGVGAQSEKLQHRSRLLSPRTAGIPRPNSHASPARPTSTLSSTAGIRRPQAAAISPPPGEGSADEERHDGPDQEQVQRPSNGPVDALPAVPRTAHSGASRGISGARTIGTTASTSLPDRTRTAPGASSSGGVAGQESWRRAAEVTQNLKARIELMKQRQGLSRPGGVN